MSTKHKSGLFTEIIERRFPGRSDAAKYGSRAAVGSVILHASCHNSSSSNVVKFWEVSDLFPVGTEQYGEVLVFVSFENAVYALVKKFKILAPTSIFAVPPPDDKILLRFYKNRSYGSFFISVTHTQELEIVSLSDILGEAVLISCVDRTVVTDVIPFEHD